VSDQAAKQVDGVLPNGEATLRLAINAAQLGIWEWDVQRNTFEYNNHGRVLYGFDRDEVITYEKLRERTHPEDFATTSITLRRALDPAVRSKDSYEYRIVRPDGEVCWVLAMGDVTFAPSNGVERPVRYIGTIQDITRRKQAEDALRVSEAQLRLALRSARLAVWEFDVATGRLTPSAELNQLFGFRGDEAPDLDALRSRYVEGEQERMRSVGQAALANGQTFFEVEVQIRLPDGALRWLALATETILDPEGTPIKAFGIVGDVTARKVQEEQLVMLVSELNHRVKNVLATVQAIANQTFGPSSEPASAHIAFKSRLNTLAHAHSLLATENWQAADLSEIVVAAISPFRKDGNIRLSFEGGADSISLSAQSAVSIAMLLHELCTNAAKYGALSVDGGIVELDWTGVTKDQGRRLLMKWREHGGPLVEPRRREGFGSKMIERGLAGELQAQVTLDFQPTGVVCVVDAAVPG
jgi:PAS domain S-box-containing protein